MRKIFWVLPISAFVIAGLVGLKTYVPSWSTTTPPTTRAVVRPAPLFQLYDEHSQILRLARYIGRHKLLIVFFHNPPGTKPCDLLQSNKLLQELRQNYDKLHETRAIVLAISSAQSAEYRLAAECNGRWPFPLLSDLNFAVHQQWGAIDPKTEQPRNAVFVIDRSGIVRESYFGPDQLGTVADWAQALKRVP